MSLQAVAITATMAGTDRDRSPGVGSSMESRSRQIALSPSERCWVVGLALGFLLVLGFLATLAFMYAIPGELPSLIADAFRAGKTRRALSGCLVLGLLVVGLPAGLALSVLAIMQGARGERTRLTRWILAQRNPKAPRDWLDDAREWHERNGHPLNTGGQPPAKHAPAFLPTAVAWGLFLSFLALVVAALVWAATWD